MATTGRFNAIDPAEPKKPASPKGKTPPSGAASQYPRTGVTAGGVSVDRAGPAAPTSKKTEASRLETRRRTRRERPPHTRIEGSPPSEGPEKGFTAGDGGTCPVSAPFSGSRPSAVLWQRLP